jgi:pyruvate kinase
VLESMIVEARPTRAEVNDAADAVDDGVDAIMLAGETAVGAHPARAAQTLASIIREAEASESVAAHERAAAHGSADVAGGDPVQDHAQALCEAAVTLAERGDASAIVAVTRGGGTARRLSALRPRVPIFATTDRDDTARRLAIYWGVVPVCTDIGEDVNAAGTLIGRQLVARGLVDAGATVVLVSINHDLARLDANYLKMQRL